MELQEYNIGTGARAFSTKRGEGSGNYAGFNITHYCGDTAEHVTECRSELCKEFGITDDKLILPRQTHGCSILCIDNGHIALTPQEQKELLEGIDAVVTDLPRTCIGVSTADCIPVLLYDEHRRVVAAIHAGWRGTVAGIATKCLTVMGNKYGCSAIDIKAIIAPGISLDSFEVGDEVYQEFANSGSAMERIAKRYPAPQGEKWHIDLWEANRLQLIEAGVKEENIQVAGICTYKCHNEFFSARRLGIQSGRIFNGIMLI